jgi:hypothetical protein
VLPQLAALGGQRAEATGEGAAAGSTADTGPKTLTAKAQVQAAAGLAAPFALPQLAALGGQRVEATGEGAAAGSVADTVPQTLTSLRRWSQSHALLCVACHALLMKTSLNVLGFIF